MSRPCEDRRVSDLLALQGLVERAGGVHAVSAYLQLDSDLIAVALNTSSTPKSERVAHMVEENTRKLILMPSQGGFFWRWTRKRVVKDWLILARRGMYELPPLERDASGTLSEEQKARLNLLGRIGL